MTYDIELGQGDTDSVSVTILENGETVDLSGYTVTFNMKSDSGTDYEIPCLAGIGEGVVTIPFTATETEESGTFVGQFLVTANDLQTTFPLGDYITVKIWRSIL
jgi:hypothetical protein